MLALAGLPPPLGEGRGGGCAKRSDGLRLSAAPTLAALAPLPTSPHGGEGLTASTAEPIPSPTLPLKGRVRSVRFARAFARPKHKVVD